MEELESPWYSWCRLCAKEDAENNVNIHLNSSQQPLTTDEDVKLTLKEALEKYFWVQSSPEDILPKQLCTDCYTLISSIKIFNERVDRVQQMYNFLIENPMYDSCDLKSLRTKFGVTDDNKEQWCYQSGTVEYVTENNQKTETDCGTEGFPECIKEESLDIWSDSDNDECKVEKVLYDEELMSKDSQDEAEDPFETMSDGSLWSEGKIDGKGTSARRNKKKAYTRTSKHTQRRKKNSTEDFVLDVVCKTCGGKFDIYSAYCEHMELAHGNASMSKLCPICDRDLQTWYHLGRHLRVHMPVESRKPIKCPECENRYTTTAQLEVHINHKHIKAKPYVCEVCGFCGGTKHSLTQHMYMHTDNAPFECEICKKKFKKRSRLNFHMDIHGPNKFVCTICGIQLNSRATLRNHLIVHSDEMQHKCDYCGKAFKQSKYLKNHLLLHTGLKPYSCNFCKQTFAVRSRCRLHMQKKHPEELASLEATGTKAYSANIPKLEELKSVAKSADNLRPIKRFSYGDIPCNFCDRTFTIRSNCRVHMKQKHPEELALMEASGEVFKFETIKTADLMEYGKTTTCDFCDQTYTNLKNCRRHIRRVHSDELALLASSCDENATKNTSKSKIQEAVSNDADEQVQYPTKSESPLDITPSSPTTDETSIQDFFVVLN